jgi:NADH:ubiquinone oxidoreductase subunit H
VGAVVVAGSFRVQEIARMQGGWPWEWLAFRNPASLLSCALLLLAARIDPGGVDPGETLGGAGPRPEREGVWVRAAARGHRLILCGLACALFLGGWALPGVAPSRQEARPWLEMLGALTFAAKVAVALIAVGWSRIAFPPPGLAAVSRATAIGRLPLALVAVSGSAAWTALGPARSTQALASGALLLVVGLALAGAARWVARGLRSSDGLVGGRSAADAEAQLSPFL